MRVTFVALLGLFAAGCAAASVPPTPVATAGISSPAASRPSQVSPEAREPTQTPRVPSPSDPPRATPIATTRSGEETRPGSYPAPRPDSFAHVITDDLRVRSKPEVSTSSKKYEPLLWEGALVWVAEGPVRASGYDWFRIVPMGEADLQYHPDPPPAGWVAAGKDGEPWIERWESSCETPLDTVSDFDWPPQGWIGLSCFGDRTVGFTAAATRWDIDCEENPELGLRPAWFRRCGESFVLDREGGFPDWERAPLFVTLAPEAQIDIDPTTTTNRWVDVRVTGHYDDARAQDCTQPADSDASAASVRVSAVHACRTRFVVTRLTPA